MSPGWQTSFGQQTAAVAGQDVDNVVIAVAPVGEVPGTVKFEGDAPDNYRNLRVSILSADDPRRGSTAIVQPDLTFVLPNVFPAVYAIQSVSGPPGYYLKSIQYGGRDASGGRFNVAAPGTPLTLTLASDTAQLSVTVQSEDGSPAAAATVMLVPEGRYALRDDLIRYANAGQNGRATIPDLAPGEYEIFAWEDVDRNLAQAPEFRSLLESRAGTVALEPAGRQSVQVQLIPAELIDEAKSKLQ